MCRYGSLININPSALRNPPVFIIKVKPFFNLFFWEFWREKCLLGTTKKIGSFMENSLALLLPFIDPLGQPKVTAGRDYCFRTCMYVRPHFSNLEKQNNRKQCSLYWRDYGFGRVDHWWHLSCVLFSRRVRLWWTFEKRQLKSSRTTKT